MRRQKAKLDLTLPLKFPLILLFFRKTKTDKTVTVFISKSVTFCPFITKKQTSI